MPACWVRDRHDWFPHSKGDSVTIMYSLKDLYFAFVAGHTKNDDNIIKSELIYNFQAYMRWMYETTTIPDHIVDGWTSEYIKNFLDETHTKRT